MKLNNNDDSHNSGLNLLIYNMLLDIESHPTWVCGLKHTYNIRVLYRDCVTPYVGVWIETVMCGLKHDNPMSHPTWVCGLKHQWPSIRQYRRWSHPAWEYMDWSIVHSSVKFMEEL